MGQDKCLAPFVLLLRARGLCLCFPALLSMLRIIRGIMLDYVNAKSFSVKIKLIFVKTYTVLRRAPFAT